jgi:hypothetical protein
VLVPDPVTPAVVARRPTSGSACLAPSSATVPLSRRASAAVGGAYPCPVLRLILALLAAAGVGALGAVVLGEYTFSGFSVLGSGLVLGLFVGEAAVTVGRRSGWLVAAGCGVIAAASMTWSAWISTGHDLHYLEPEGWVAVALAAVAAGIRGWWSRPARDSPPPKPAPAE